MKRKLISLTDQQYELMQRLMKETYQGSASGFFVYLMVSYEQNQKRPPGRPRSTTNREDDATPPSQLDPDDIEMYKVPDKFTTSPYSYNDLVAWYEAHPEAGTIPARENLTIHKDFKGAH